MDPSLLCSEQVSEDQLLLGHENSTDPVLVFTPDCNLSALADSLSSYFDANLSSFSFDVNLDPVDGVTTDQETLPEPQFNPNLVLGNEVFLTSLGEDASVQENDNQLLYVTYTPHGSSEQQVLILPSNLLSLPADKDCTEPVPQLCTEENQEFQQFQDELQNINKDMDIEAKFQVLESVVPKAPQVLQANSDASRKKFGQFEFLQSGEAKLYKCDLCEVSFNTAPQYYGHLNAHVGERKWKCSECCSEFDTQSALRVHEQMHSNCRPYSCSICFKGFGRPSQLKYHMQRIHDNIKPYQCRFCKKTFYKRSDLRMHVNVHLGIKQSICETCGRQFSHVSNLLRHIRTHTGVKPYPCNLCGRRFRQINSLQNHKLSHLQKKNFPCLFCRKAFQSNASLQKHSKLMHGSIVPVAKGGAYNKQQNRRYYCTVCGDSFDFLAQLKDHRRIHDCQDTFYCKGCDKTFASGDELASHSCIDSVLPEPFNNHIESLLQDCMLPDISGLEDFGSVDDSKDGVPTSSSIDPGQQTAHQLKDEFTFFTNIKEDRSVTSDIVKQADPSPKKKPYVCQECNKTFTKSTNLKQHMGIHFVDMKKYKCEICDISFAWKSTLNKHMATHRQDQNQLHKCHVCDKQYSTPTQVSDHVKRDHEKLRPHTCHYCKKDFYKKSDLKVHTRTHTREKPYICSLCGKKFSHLSHIIRHERIHSGDKPYRCDDCGRKFNQSSSLKSHRCS